jgi:DNA-binding NtrC family response regulator
MERLLLYHKTLLTLHPVGRGYFKMEFVMAWKFEEVGWGTKNILIGGYKRHFREYYEPTLTENGYNVILKNTIVDILETMNSRNDIDVVIVDYDIFCSNELVLLRKIRKMKDAPRFILNFDYPHFRDDYLTWMADECILEPIDADELVYVVGSLIDARDSEDADTLV